MTPMNQLKNNISTFTGLMGSAFSEITLNKSTPKSYVRYFCGDRTEHHDKGVKSDFIKIYSIKFNKEDSYSLAFTFSYIDLPKEKQSVSFSFKSGGVNESIVESEDMSIEDFKMRLNSVNNELKSKSPLEYSDTIKIICAEFISNFKLGNLAQIKKLRKSI